MSTIELLTTTLYFLLIASSSYFFGRRVFGRRDGDMSDHGAYIALGLTTLGYGALILGLFGAFNQLALTILVALMLLIGLYKYRLPVIKLKLDWASGGIILATLSMLASVYLASMQPPHTSDELNYHFPQSQVIVDSEHIDLTFGGHYFYGAIPKHLEIIFAVGIAQGGYSLAHSLHFLYFVSFVVVVFGILYRTVGVRSASLAVFLLLMYQDLTWNVSSGFVDGAAFCLEIMGLLYTLSYLNNHKRDSHDIRLAGLLIGSGLAIKYSVGITAVFATIVLLPNWRAVFELIRSAILMGGFWYGKNLILFGNPTYPLYFGHKGISDTEYQSLMVAIQQFGAKNGDNFVRLMSYFVEVTRLPVYISLLISPLSLQVARSTTFVRLLLLYVVLYIPYWFFLGTHQLRFFAPAAIVAMILTAITLSRIRARWLILMFVTIQVIIFTTPYYGQTVGSYFWNTRLHFTERQYGLGNLTQDQFMHRWYGCYYDTIIYLNQINDGRKVVDNWSYGIDFNVPFYSVNHEYVLWTDQSVEKMRKQNIGYLYIREGNKTAYSHRSESWFGEAIPVYTAFDQYFIARSKLIKQIDDCSIYRLNEDDLGSAAK